MTEQQFLHLALQNVLWAFPPTRFIDPMFWLFLWWRKSSLFLSWSALMRPNDSELYALLPKVDCKKIQLNMKSKLISNVPWPVGLSATGAGETPILLDSTPPVAGYVLDGSQLGHDVCCQVSDTQVCAQWVDFHDPDSYIDRCDVSSGYSWVICRVDFACFSMLTLHSRGTTASNVAITTYVKFELYDTCMVKSIPEWWTLLWITFNRNLKDILTFEFYVIYL